MDDEAREKYHLDRTIISTFKLKWIKNFYKDKGEQLIKYFFIKPYKVVPVVLERVQNIQRHLLAKKQEKTTQWREIYAKNYYKSLDYRSFHFKNNEKKHMTTKNLMQNLK